jgi:hypothetical protein
VKPESWRRQRRRCLIGLAGLPLLAAGCALRPRAPRATPAPGQVAPFSASPADGAVPRGWQEYRVRRDIPPSEYGTVADEGRTVLRARSQRGSSGLNCLVDVEPANRPWVEWRWRAQTVPFGARCDDVYLDDSPARVVLAFDGDIARLPLADRIFFEEVEVFTGQQLPYAMLMYNWDATLAAGSAVSYGRCARIRNLVVQSGPDGVGQWLAYRRNYADDFRRVFGEEPGPLVSVGVLTDADDLKVPMLTDYGDITLLAG